MHRGAAKAILFRWARAVYPYALSVGKAADIRRGSWREPELGLIPKFVQPGQTAIDIGANYGLWSYHLARAAGPTGRVVSFEPIPATVGALRRILWLLGVKSRVDVVPAGAGERNGPLRFEIPTNEMGIPIGGLAHAESGEDRPHITVDGETRRVDEVPVPGEVAFLKVDVEGAELFALRGAEQTLREHEPIIVCEVGADLLESRYGISVDDLTGYLGGLGYSGPMRYHDGELRLVSFTDGYDGNYVFATERRLPTSLLDQMRA